MDNYSAGTSSARRPLRQRRFHFFCLTDNTIAVIPFAHSLLYAPGRCEVVFCLSVAPGAIGSLREWATLASELQVLDDGCVSIGSNLLVGQIKELPVGIYKLIVSSSCLGLCLCGSRYNLRQLCLSYLRTCC